MNNMTISPSSVNKNDRIDITIDNKKYAENVKSYGSFLGRILSWFGYASHLQGTDKYVNINSLFQKIILANSTILDNRTQEKFKEMRKENIYKNIEPEIKSSLIIRKEIGSVNIEVISEKIGQILSDYMAKEMKTKKLIIEE